ncbi:hypothetical protein HK102_001259 [Quaeritorhiza haematococci]|nr:hypothetical protein HK102_001259 [Quaeritorhiza haematococci]
MLGTQRSRQYPQPQGRGPVRHATRPVPAAHQLQQPLHDRHAQQPASAGHPHTTNSAEVRRHLLEPAGLFCEDAADESSMYASALPSMAFDVVPDEPAIDIERMVENVRGFRPEAVGAVQVLPLAVASSNRSVQRPEHPIQQLRAAQAVDAVAQIRSATTALQKPKEDEPQLLREVLRDTPPTAPPRRPHPPHPIYHAAQNRAAAQPQAQLAPAAEEEKSCRSASGARTTTDAGKNGF